MAGGAEPADAGFEVDEKTVARAFDVKTLQYRYFPRAAVQQAGQQLLAREHVMGFGQHGGQRLGCRRLRQGGFQGGPLETFFSLPGGGPSCRYLERVMF